VKTHVSCVRWVPGKGQPHVLLHMHPAQQRAYWSWETGGDHHAPPLSHENVARLSLIAKALHEIVDPFCMSGGGDWGEFDGLVPSIFNALKLEDEDDRHEQLVSICLQAGDSVEDRAAYGAWLASVFLETETSELDPEDWEAIGGPWKLTFTAQGMLSIDGVTTDEG